MDRLTIVKVGGKILEEAATLDSFLKDFSRVAGYKLLVHGGGRSATRLAEQLGVESKMVDGRRITDEATLRIVTMVYAGLVNKTVVAKLQALGTDAFGLTGADMNTILSKKREAGAIDYGFVGDVKRVNVSALADLLKEQFVPVLAPITHDGEGNLLNTNADTIAGEAAKSLARVFDVRLIYCFEKSGVLTDENDEKSLIPYLDLALYEEYKQDGIIQGGMIPKLDNAFQALAAGVKEVVITKASAVNTGKGTYIR